VTPDLCPHCGQVLPRSASYLTPRELELLSYWWMTQNVRRSAVRAGVSEQRAKNMLRAARIRNGVATNYDLLALHFVAVRSAVDARMPQNNDQEEVA
jgi:DNA-binding CsgD family transcriptional regulator